jgi:hypothetical protein
LSMVPCPHCGALNSEKRTTCCNCQGELAPPKAAPADGGQVHKFCIRATPYAPPGEKLAPEDVWCTVFDKAVKADEHAPSDCFVPAFKWERTEALD